MSEKKLVTIRGIITRKVVSVFPDTPLLEAIQKLVKYKFNGLPVVNESNVLVGILTEADLISKNIFSRVSSLNILFHDLSLLREYRARANEEMFRLSSLFVRDVMNPDPLVFNEKAGINEITHAFRVHHRVNPIPIVDDDYKVVGIVSRSDVLKTYRFLKITSGLFLGYKNFMRKSIFSSPDDIERPYHKIVNLVLKILGVAFILFGLWLIYIAGGYFIEFKNVNIADKTAQDNILLALIGIGSILIGIFISLVLILRYVAFTLPDRIYTRQYVSNEKK